MTRAGSGPVPRPVRPARSGSCRARSGLAPEPRSQDGSWTGSTPGSSRAAARTLPSDSTIVANADDAQLWHALKGLDPVGFSVEADHEEEGAAADAEPETCPECGGPLRFSRRTMANLGSARCDACGWRS